jgi:uncharacterized protein YndB with AHSA1/START domain
MWSKTYRKKVQGLKAEQVWKVWTDLNQWHTWQSDIEYAKLEGEFKVGNTFLLKPKGGPRVNIEIIKVEPNLQFTDLTRFPGAKMYGSHEFVIHGDELEIKTTMSIEGPLPLCGEKSLLKMLRME